LSVGGAGGRGESVEQEGQSAGEDTLNAGNLVTGCDQVLQGGQNRQTGTNGALMVDMSLALSGGGEDILPQRQVVGETLLVGGNDGDALLQECRVLLGEVDVRGIVNQDGTARSRSKICGNLLRGKGTGLGDGGSGSSGSPVGRGNGRVGRGRGEKSLRGTSKEDELRRVGEARKLVQEGSSNTTDTWLK